MGYDAMTNAVSIPSSMVSGKKKRANRSARLKQCKLDARREQWLSQGKDKDDCGVTKLANSILLLHPPRAPSMREDGRDDVPSLHECRDLDSSFDKRNHHTRNSLSSRSTSSSLDSISRSDSDGEEEEDTECRGEENGVLDDWEAVADALSAEAASENNRQHRPLIASIPPAAMSGASNEAPHGGSATKPDPVLPNTARAWRPDDRSRPQSLPSISKQWPLPVNAAGHHHWASQQKGILPLPISCPICYEDLDLTDSTFLPCSCGFRLCLFCHKRILEADSRCPGCRKQYSSVPGGTVEVNMGVAPVVQLQLSHSCRMFSRP